MSDSLWFLHYNFTQHGPFKVSDLRDLLKEGKISSKTYAWRKGMRDWSRIADTPELLMELGTPAEKTRTQTRTRARARGFLKKIRATAREAPEAPAPAPAPAPEPQPPRDSRTSPRKPLVAHVVFTDQSQVSVGLCRDISETGVLVLTDKVPGPVGTFLTVNISPSDDALPPFKVSGRIVRVLESGGDRGYALRFESLGEKERSLIAEFLKKS